jgi:serine/threonine protein kinase
LIGTGGFSQVFEVTGVTLDEIYETSAAASALRRDFCHQTTHQRTSHGHPVFCLKLLRTDLSDEEHTKGVLDLAIEADFLGLLQHPHILPLRGLAHGDYHQSRFFVVLDRLSVTLDKKFNYWRKIVGQAGGTYLPVFGYCCANTPLLQALWGERHAVMLQIASALQYLHAQGIVYRDLKPDNIGFDDADGVKLFDFGLAKRWNEAELAERGGALSDDGTLAATYHLTGQTGSLRYMAPEVAKEEPYNESVDVYSWGILYWQVCALQTPFSKFTARAHSEQVVHGGLRPTLDKTWPLAWRQLQQRCWSSAASERPSMAHVLAQVQEFTRVLGADDADADEYIQTTGGGDVETTDPTTSSSSSSNNNAGKIKAKQKKKATADDQLDVDTRLGAGPTGGVV